MVQSRHSRTPQNAGWRADGASIQLPSALAAMGQRLRSRTHPNAGLRSFAAGLGTVSETYSPRRAPLGACASGAAYVRPRLPRKAAEIWERLAYLGPIEQEAVAAGLALHTVAKSRGAATYFGLAGWADGSQPRGAF